MTWTSTPVQLCEACECSSWPGALWPVVNNDSDPRAYVERCDECSIHVDDAEAARARRMEGPSLPRGEGFRSKSTASALYQAMRRRGTVAACARGRTLEQ